MGTLADITNVVVESAHVNIPQLCGTEDGRVLVQTYDWKAALSIKFRNIPHLKTYHHFRFTCDHPGTVFVKTHADTEEMQLVLTKSLTWSPSASQLPPIVNPRGLLPERQWYLYEHIRQFCPEYARDTVAPLPRVAKPGSSRPQNATDVPPSKRAKHTR